jgi:hypothetical protein
MVPTMNSRSRYYNNQNVLHIENGQFPRNNNNIEEKLRSSFSTFAYPKFSSSKGTEQFWIKKQGCFIATEYFIFNTSIRFRSMDRHYFSYNSFENSIQLMSFLLGKAAL